MFAVGIIAHRGASGSAPENTIAAVKLAIEMKVDFVEIDVQMSKDGHVVLMHDSTVNRTTSGKGVASDLTIEELKSFDAGSWYDRKFYMERVPTLAEILKLDFKDSKLIIEVKNSSNYFKGIEQKIHDLVLQFKKNKIVVYKSFNMDTLERFEKIAPDVERLYVILGPVFGLFYIDEALRLGSPFDFKNYKYLQVHKYLLNKELIEDAKSRDIKIIVWDVQNKMDGQKFSNLGVHFIETDFPESVLELIEKK